MLAHLLKKEALTVQNTSNEIRERTMTAFNISKRDSKDFEKRRIAISITGDASARCDDVMKTSLCPTRHTDGKEMQDALA